MQDKLNGISFEKGCYVGQASARCWVCGWVCGKTVLMCQAPHQQCNT